ncbi:MAG: ATP-dependent zinc metalloprotease FtsH [Candidatus Promineofilum sp.]|nr:ATP-dependent zinc metalloprotease FtsH [Promineifilum sp.]MCW5863683.1 ATP-dependent zinc metalloprotease FtsH [Anaerolineae bacterium]
MDDQPNENRPNIPTWVWILTLFAIILGVQLWLSGRFSGPEQVSLQEVADFIRDDKVEQISVTGDRLQVTLTDGRTFGAVKSPSDSLIETFEYYGISAEDLNNKLVVHDQSTWNTLLSLAFTIGPILLLLWIFSRSFRQMQGGGGNNIFGFGRSRARNLTDANRPTVTFEDVAGVEEAKLELAEVVQFLREPEKFVQVGARIPKGVLMVGPPGTGKTLLARAVAGEAGVPFFHISGSEFVEMFVGVGASRVRDLFEKAKQAAPSIVFVDEIDAVGRQRGAGLGGGHDEREQTLNQILVEMDGFDNETNVIVIAATNRADILDPALLRPGRFDRKVFVDLPDVAGREKILAVHARGKPIASEVSFKEISRLTAGFSGADLENLINEAAIFAARRSKRTIGLPEFQDAFDRVVMGPERQSRVMSEDDKLTVAYHEVGHAVVSFFLTNTDPVQKITIVPHGRAGGFVMSLPEDRAVHSREFFEDQIAMALGGRAAEEHFFGRITTGAAADLQQATRLARAMVMEYGMSDRLGLPTYGGGSGSPFVGREMGWFGSGRDYSEEAAREIDAEVKRLLDENYNRANTIIEQNHDRMVHLATTLIEVETLDRAAFEKLMNEMTPSNGQISAPPLSSPQPAKAL